jgi:hypothetical protein
MKKLNFFEKLKNSKKENQNPQDSQQNLPTINMTSQSNISNISINNGNVNKSNTTSPLKRNNSLMKQKHLKINSSQNHNTSNAQNNSYLNSTIKKKQNQNNSNTNYFKSKFGYTEDKEDQIEDSMIIDKNNIKDLIDNATPEQKVLNLIDDTLELFGKGMFLGYILPDDGAEKYELIEKFELEKLKNENDSLRIKKNNKTEEFYTLANNYHKTKNELTLIDQKFSNEEKYKSDHVNKIYSLQDTLNQILVENSKIQELINKENVEKENIYRALIHFQNKNSNKIPEKLKEIYNKLKDSKEYFSKPYNVSLQSQDKVETLKLRIESLEKSLKLKNEEIKRKRLFLSKDSLK